MSSLHRSAPAWFDRLAFVLVRPSHPGNVGAVARAMRTMGLRQLVLVAPREPDVLDHPEAVSRASGATDVLRQARVAGSLAEALAPFTLAVAVSAEEREFGPRAQAPEDIARQVRGELRAQPQARIAFVFGPERTGLSIEDALPCQLMCSIPGESDYSSLNLSQAAQIVAYCLRSIDRLEPLAGGPQQGEAGEARRAAGAEATGTQASDADGAAPDGRPASIEAIDGMFAHLEAALVRVGFLDPEHPKKLMPRLRRLFGRTRLETEEIAILRGICTQILKLADGNIHGPSRSRVRAGHDDGSGPLPSAPGKSSSTERN